jgi:hypothetical protein
MSSQRTAVNILKSWLAAAGAVVSKSEDPACLVVNGVRVAIAEGGRRVPEAAVTVSAEDVRGRRPAKLVEAFHAVTEAAGMGKPKPPGRPAGDLDPKTGEMAKVDNNDDAFMVALRHAEFRRTVNPPAGSLERYRPIVERTARAFRRFNLDFCKIAGYDAEDLVQFGMLWATTYIGLYERGADLDEDKKLLTAYLQQRFAEFFQIYQKRLRSAVPDADTASVAMFGEPFHRRGGNYAKPGSKRDGGPEPEGVFFVDPRTPGEEDEVLDVEESEEAVEARRKEASGCLNALMEDPEAISEFERVAFSPVYDPEARDEARRRWRRLFAALPRAGQAQALREIVANQAYEPALRRDAAALLRSHEKARDGRSLPQANSLGLLRRLVEAVRDGKSGLNDLSEAVGFCTRQVEYYRRAAAVLGLVGADERVAALGRALLATEAGSPAELAAWRRAIGESDTMSLFSWFFDDRRRGMAELVRYIAKEFDVGGSSAYRRAESIWSWRRQLPA